MSGRLSRVRLVGFLLIAAVVAVIGILTYGFELFRRLELDSVDARFSIRGTQRPPTDLVVVKIDDVTFDDLDLQWPFPRSLHAKVIDRLNRDGAKVIAYDVQMSEPTDLTRLVKGGRHRVLLQELGDKEDGSLLYAEMRAGRKLVLSTTEVDDKTGEPNVLFGAKGLRVTGARAGSTNVRPDPGGVLRRLPYSVDGLKSFAVVAVEAATGRRVPRAEFDSDGAWIDYRGPPGTIPSVSFSRVARGTLRPGFFRGKTVVVGAAAPSLQDIHPTSTGEGMSGPEVQANAISTVRRSIPLDSSPVPLDLFLILLFVCVAPAASLRVPARGVFLIALAAGAAYLLIVQLTFNAGVILPVVYPLGALALAAVGTLVLHYVTAALDRQHVRDVFSRFVPEQVVDEALLSASDDLRLPAVRRQCTVMFADLRGFTSFAEPLRPELVVDVLNRYLSEMGGAILDNGGTLVAYMGDGIMAVFGAPIEQPDHADRALNAAREMLWRLGRFNQWIRAEGLGEGFRMGIGVNSGTVMSGNIGSERRMEYTAIGDTTNAAARLEGMTKETPYQVLVSDSTRAMLRGDAPDLTYVDAVPVRGKVVKANLWGLADPDSPPA
jgi:adenylate cyclase